MSARYRIARQVERTLERCPEIRSVFIDYGGDPGGVLSLLPPEMRDRVVFARNAAMPARVATELPPPRRGAAPERER